MRFFIRFIALVSAIILIFTLTACDNTDKAYIYFRLPEKPSTLDPQTAQTDAELLIIKNIFEGLLRKDENGKIVTGVAESYSLNGHTYTFKLRKDAVWSNGEKLAANDFVFGFRRAIEPETKSPFATRLYSIKNAKAVNKGKKEVTQLGVKAVDEYTLKIELDYIDQNFEEILTTSIAMPCNEEFFYSSGGKYGLFKENTLSNGSYKLSKWGKEIFGIRLYRNDTYTGKFIAKNAAVFLSHDEKEQAIDLLTNEDADITFINSYDSNKLNNTEIETVSYENICWFLTISDNLPNQVRKSLCMLANSEVFSKDLTTGYSAANSVYPSILNVSPSATGMHTYDLSAAKKLFSNGLDNLKDKKIPSDAVLYYYDDGFSKKIVTDVVGHWQNHLGAFVNIESVSSPDVLASQLKKQTYSMCIFPVWADSPLISEYLQKFGINYNKESFSDIQAKILKSNNIVPLMFQSTTLAYSKKLSNVNIEHGNGCLDFSFIIKQELK